MSSPSSRAEVVAGLSVEWKHGESALSHNRCSCRFPARIVVPVGECQYHTQPLRSEPGWEVQPVLAGWWWEVEFRYRSVCVCASCTIPGNCQVSFKRRYPGRGWGHLSVFVVNWMLLWMLLRWWWNLCPCLVTSAPEDGGSMFLWNVEHRPANPHGAKTKNSTTTC
jgi:hypothetical protein